MSVQIVLGHQCATKAKNWETVKKERESLMTRMLETDGEVNEGALAIDR